MSIKCIALDLDRTTLNIDGKLSKENKAALEYAISRGVHIVVASGRAFDTLPRDVIEVSGIEYAITSNGTAVYHIPTKKCLHQYKLTKDSIKEIIQLSKSEKVTYEAFIDGKAYADSTYIDHPEIFGANEQAIAYIRETRNMVENIEQFIKEHIEELDCMDIITKDNELKRTLMEQLKNDVEGIYVTSSIEQLIEISNEQAGKHSGVKFIMELLKLKQEEIAAFGDGDNDIDMLKFVGTGIAVENASEQCKNAADMITKHHNENGVAYGIYEMLKI
jgi:Cof subfamily protein (haloacid dehalogenase superfamily)